jgi:hypothetical protein
VVVTVPFACHVVTGCDPTTAASATDTAVIAMPAAATAASARLLPTRTSLIAIRPTYKA